MGSELGVFGAYVLARKAACMPGKGHAKLKDWVYAFTLGLA